MKHKLLPLMLVLLLAVFALTACGEQPGTYSKDGMDIVFGDGFVKIDGKKHDLAQLTGGKVASLEIGRNDAERVLITLKNEQHAEVKPYLADVKNTVVTVVAGGSYVFSGDASDTQIAVDAPGAEVELVLNGLQMECYTAAVIQVYDAADPQTPGEYGVSIITADDSVNRISGAYTAKTEQDQIAHDGAISSNVSLGFGGDGILEVSGFKEGIEVKYGHLTFDGGTLWVSAQDDPISASEDGVAVITFNDGTVLAYVDGLAEEGDGVDSNGSIVINGGTLIASACADSPDSGLDADCGITINGGTVVAAGNMRDDVDAASTQRFMQLQLADTAGTLLALAPVDGTPLLGYEVPQGRSQVLISSPFITDGSYHLFAVESISGVEYAGLYTEITDVTGKVQLGWNTEFGRKPQPEGGQPPKDMFGMGNLNGIEITPEGAVLIAEEAAEKLIQIFEGLTMTVDRSVEEIMEIDSLEELEDFFNEVTTGLYLPQSWVIANLLPPGMQPQGWRDKEGTNEPPLVVLQPLFNLSAEQYLFGNVQPFTAETEVVPAPSAADAPAAGEPPQTQIQ